MGEKNEGFRHRTGNDGNTAFHHGTKSVFGDFIGGNGFEKYFIKKFCNIRAFVL